MLGIAPWRATSAVLATVFFQAGCQCPPVKPPSAPVPLSKVLNAVKDELASFMSSASTVKPEGVTCFDPKGKPAGLQPKTATVTLQVVDSRQWTAGASAGIEVGVLQAGGAGSSKDSEKFTQTLVVPLTVVAPKTPIKKPEARDYPVAATLSRIRDELLMVDRDRTPCLKYDAKTPLKLSIAFEVEHVGDKGVTLKLLAFELGATKTQSMATTQTLDIELALVDESGNAGTMSREESK